MWQRRQNDAGEKPKVIDVSNETSFHAWLQQEIKSEPYWFHRMQLGQGIETPGWSDPAHDKLPYFGLPRRLDGLRVLDVGCAEGFFSFEAERRGAREVVAVDSFPDSVRRFNICRAALGSKATAFLCNVTDITPKAFGTFDLVMFFGVLYHLRNPILALERLHAVCTGTLLLQTLSEELSGTSDVPYAKFYPFGMPSGPAEAPQFDPTVFWVPNVACVDAMVRSAGFVEVVSHGDPHVSCVLQARASVVSPGNAPDQTKAPWS